MEARVGIEPALTDLQSAALPLCHRAIKEHVLRRSAKYTDFELFVIRDLRTIIPSNETGSFLEYAVPLRPTGLVYTDVPATH